MFKAQVSHFHEEQSKTQSKPIFYSKFEMNTKKTFISLGFIHLGFHKNFLDRRPVWNMALVCASGHVAQWTSESLKSQLTNLASRKSAWQRGLIIFWIQLCRLTKTSFPFCSVERKRGRLGCFIMLSMTYFQICLWRKSTNIFWCHKNGEIPPKA